MPLTRYDVLPIFADDPDVVETKAKQATADAALAASGTASGSALFDLWRAELSGLPVLSEFTNAMLRLVTAYNPSHRANRHLVGGAVEYLLAAMLTTAGPAVEVHGDDANGFDLSASLPNGALETLSVKSSFGRSDYKISNGLGGSGKGLSHPTLFLGPSLPGLVLAHPDMHPEVVSALRDTGDGWALPRRAVVDHAAGRPECVLRLGMPEMSYPYNYGGESGKLVASRLPVPKDHGPIPR